MCRHTYHMLNVRERREAAAKREAAELIDLLGPERVSTLLNVHLTTVKRWLSGEVVAQTPVLIALRTITGRWGVENKAWEGWVLRDNWLWSPAGERFHPGDLLGRRYQLQLQKHLERRIRLLEAKLRAIDTGAANDAIGQDFGAAAVTRT